MTKSIEAYGPKAIETAIQDGNRPYVSGGYSSIEEIKRMRDAASAHMGKDVAVRYSKTHNRYYFELKD